MKIKIPVRDFYFTPATVTYRGKSIRVLDYELFTLIIAGWQKRFNWTKKEAYEEFFFGFDL